MFALSQRKQYVTHNVPQHYGEQCPKAIFNNMAAPATNLAKHQYRVCLLLNLRFYGH